MNGLRNIASYLCCLKTRPAASPSLQNQVDANENMQGIAVQNPMQHDHLPAGDVINGIINNQPVFEELPHFAFPVAGAAGDNALPQNIPHAPSDDSIHTDIGDEVNLLGAVLGGFDPHNLAAAAEELDPVGVQPAAHDIHNNHQEEDDIGHHVILDIEEDEPAQHPFIEMPQVVVQQQQQVDDDSVNATSSEASSIE